MASASSSLSEEFKCPIHLDELVNPKIMGPCFHTACLDCVAGLVRTSGRRGVFSCPVCREDCCIPRGGVQNLKDNFLLKSIMDRYRNVQENTAGIKCIACGNAASHFCKKCESIFLCPPCSRKHDLNPDTSDHELIGICKEHGKTLSKFCRGCNEAICSVCRISKHSGSGNHNVTSHDEVVNDETTIVIDRVVSLEGNLTKKEQHRKGLQQIHDSAVERVESDLGKVAEKADSVIAICDRKHDELSSKRRDLLEQLNAVEKDLSETEKKRTDVRISNEKYCQVLRNQRDIRLAKVRTSLAQHAIDMADVQTKIDEARTVTSRKRVFDEKTVPSLVHIREDLEKLSIAAEQDDDVTPFLDIENKMVRFVPSDDDMEIGDLVGEFLKREFTSVEKVADLSYPPDRLCYALFRLKHDDNGRVVSIYVSEEEPGVADSICVYDTKSPGECLIKITKDIQPAVDMTITSTGEVMVLRRAERAIRAFSFDSGTFRNITVCFGDKLVDQNCGIEADDEGNIFVLNGDFRSSNVHLLVFNTEGNLIHDVKIGRAIRMWYCRSKTILYIAAYGSIVGYQWNGSMLGQISSLPHGVEGFNCTDLCIGSAGEMFVTGWIGQNHEIVIYQIMEEEDRSEEEESGAEPGSVAQSGNVSSGDGGEEANKNLKMVRINFSDNIRGQAVLLPSISVRDTTLVLGYHSGIEVFKLKP